ncbi:MAG: cation:dicarboxylate symporter family transporter [Enterocloster bolteae]
MGIPLEIVIMVGGFYRFFDMGTTTMNCLGDMSATVIIDRLEKKENAKDWVRRLTVKGKEEKR